MTQIQYPNDVTGSIQIARGSDGRLNVSSRVDERIFYVSRDNGDAYSWSSFDSAAAVGEYTLYIQNTSPTKKLVLKEIVLAPGVAMTFKIATTTGTAAGTLLTAFNLNRDSGNVAPDNSFGNAAVTGLTEDTLFHTVHVPALETEHVEFHDALILGQNDNIAVECDVNGGGLLYITATGYFE